MARWTSGGGDRGGGGGGGSTGGTLDNSWGKEARVSGATGGALSHTRKNSPLQLQQRPSASTDQFPHHQHRTQRERQVRLGLQKLLEDTTSGPPPTPGGAPLRPPHLLRPLVADVASIPASGSSFTRLYLHREAVRDTLFPIQRLPLKLHLRLYAHVHSPPGDSRASRSGKDASRIGD